MKNLSSAAVVIPVYKAELNELEKISLTQCRKVLKNYPLVFVAPEGKNFSYLEPNEILVQFSPQYFKSVKSYSQLLLLPLFYEPFLSFDYMLIYQLDAFVFYDALEEFCQLGYDYIGAPWPYHTWLGSRYPKTPRVGNGGFCLRNVKACHKLLSEAVHWANFESICKNSSEDGVFAFCGMSAGRNFKVAPLEVAKFFSMEYRPELHVKRFGNILPFGCHGWTKFSADFYVKLFAKFGYDLRPLRAKMGDTYYEVHLPFNLTKLAMDHLIRRVERGQAVLKYLPTQKFSSVRVIRSPDAMKILAQLIVDDNSITDKIFIYDEKDFRDLIRDVTRENLPLPHLVLCTDYDKSLTGAIEQKGLTYGEHVISFRQEYLKAQENLFHNLGRSIRNGD